MLAMYDEPQHTHESDPRAHFDQVVLMLKIDVGRAVERFAGLKRLRRPAIANGERLERHHAFQREDARTNLPARRPHQPVLRFDLVEIGELAMLVVQREHGPIDHPFPRTTVVGGRVSRLWIDSLLIGVQGEKGRRRLR